MTINRRQFLRGALGLSGAAVIGADLLNRNIALAVDTVSGAGVDTSAAAAALPHPAASGIDHVVVVMMENRSFDHFLGWLPNADGIQSGLAYADPSGKKHPIYHQTQSNGCGFNDPDHSYAGGRIQYHKGKMDGFLTDKANDLYSVGYYEAADRPFMSQLALEYTTCDRYFCSILGPTYPNRFFQHAAGTDRLDNSSTTSTLPTIWDQLNHTGGPTGRYYFSDLPFLALWGSKYVGISSPYEQFLADASSASLPNVSYVDPRFLGEGQGGSNDDHPLADIRAGDALLSEIFHAVSSSPAWSRTVLVVNYDEWGGFYEHVPPPRATPGVPGIDTDTDAHGNVLLGFRVPCIIASPFTRGNPANPAIASGLYDHTSVLRFIQWRWGLKPVGRRDASRSAHDPGNLATALNFSKADATVPASIPSVLPPPFAACPPVSAPSSGAAAAPDTTWTNLASSGLLRGWGLGR